MPINAPPPLASGATTLVAADVPQSTPSRGGAAQRTVRVYQVDQTGSAPVPAGELVVEAAGVDGLLEAAGRELAARGHRVRCLSWAPAGLLAYVENAG